MFKSIDSNDINVEIFIKGKNSYQFKQPESTSTKSRKVFLLKTTLDNICKELIHHSNENNPKLILIHGEFAQDLSQQLQDKYQNLSIFYSQKTLDDISRVYVQKTFLGLTYMIQIDNESLHYYK